jgi:hypothetical protein
MAAIPGSVIMRKIHRQPMEHSMKSNSSGRRSAATPVQPKSGKTHWLELPAEIASRLDALCQRHPDKTRSQVVDQLLNWALAEQERGGAIDMAPAPAVPAAAVATVYLPTGPFAEFHGLEFKHHLATERERDPLDPQKTPPAGPCIPDDTA